MPIATKPTASGARWRDGVWAGYALAAGATAIALWLRWGLDKLLGEGIPHYITFFPAVIVSALLGGARAGMAATLLSAVAVDYFFLQPTGSLAIRRPGDMAALSIFILISLVMSAVGGTVRAGRRRAEQQARELNEHVRRLTQANESLRQTEDRLRLQSAAMESAADAIVITDRKGDIQWANQAFTRLTGYSVSEVLGKNPRILKSGKMAPEVYQGLWQTVLEGRVWHGRLINKRKDGRLFVEETTIAPVRGAEGQIANFVAIKTDITQRTEAEQRLQTQLGEMKLLEDVTLAIGQHQDMESIFQVAVDRLEDQLHIDFACVCTHDPATGALAVASVGARSESLDAALALKEGFNLQVDKDGLSRCVAGRLVYESDTAHGESLFTQGMAGNGLRSIVLAPLQVESQVLGVLLAARTEPGAFSGSECDFIKQLSEHVALASHQAKLHEALKKAYDELRQSQQVMMQQERLRALGEMASGTAHDINNALAPALLCAESLLETETHLSERSRDYLETVHRAIQDVANTVARMREFYRQREQQMTAEPVRVNLLAKQVMVLTRARWSDIPQQQGIVIKTSMDLDPKLPAAMGVESEIRDALVNLVLNAADAMPDGGTLTIRTSRGADKTGLSCVMIEVADTGHGMDEETRRRCLEPFYTTKGERGSGLGLAMVYGAVRRHGGGIEIDSAPGRGTTVRLSLPIGANAGEAPDAAPDKSRAVARVPAHLRILVVDDDPLVIDSLRSVLETEGHLVTEARGGLKGIEAFLAVCGGKESFDTVVTDLGMPSVDGWQVAKAIKQASPATPVVMLTGWGQQLLAEGRKSPHVDQILSKPVTLQDLRDALSKAIHRPGPSVPEVPWPHPFPSDVK